MNENRAGLLYLLLFFFLIGFNSAEAQQKKTTRTPAKKSTAKKAPVKSKAQLEREKNANLKRIQEANRILQQTAQKKQASLGQLNVIKEKITVQKGVIKNISSEIVYLNRDLRTTEEKVADAQADLQRLKKEYSRLIYAASKSANSYNKLMFLFAADSFNQMMRRMRYLRQYTEARKNQAAAIEAVQQNLNSQLNTLTSQKKQKKSLLNVQLNENKNLLSMHDQQDQVIQQLSLQEQSLKQELEQRQKAVQQLDRLIANIVREEIARAARAAEAAARAKAAREAAAAARAAAAAGKPAPEPAATANAPAKTKATVSRTDRVTLTPEAAALSSNFAGNKGRFSWPVERGFISQRFGRQAHPVLKGVVVENRGIDIQTGANENVRAIFGGKVLAVQTIPGMNNIVMVQHGEYFTVYAKLRTVNVSEGQEISTKQTIGTVYTDAEGTSELQFQIWKNQTNLNPQGWLMPK
ncbi:peptidoglycan DD-metalloendopeptidase family protein [Rufibacter sp. H-1]|uniref:Peptidoglycan DD-metalloendopeptidase family protein n=1 Tax=Rufibacter sediminis TaxID=2762756 RepID=A0ABR6VUI2_9BACT|nr:peptidoglycan DD-metalloendopeptidase family protein [Rufibacter sediminis]MBC3540806.1 peptidoglycan DD-metalloendopeptidase family protein [Rufibacter sediminis]